MTWVDAWDEAARVYFGEPPPDVRKLLNIVRDLPFRAPEVMGADVRKAWHVYQEWEDSEIGRAAVALAYAIQADRDNAKGRAQ